MSWGLEFGAESWERRRIREETEGPFRKQRQMKRREQNVSEIGLWVEAS